MWTELHHANCLAVLAKMKPDSIDTFILDPPYGLEFMGQDWDHGVPGVPFWEAALRVAKPGATLLAFGGTRTHHRLMVAIEDAGWLIRDCMMWLYGSGFTKGQNISKALDKAAGAVRADAITGGHIGVSHHGGDGPNDHEHGLPHIIGKGTISRGTPATPAAELWEGWGTTLKPAWEPIVMAMKTLDGTFVHNAQEHGVAGIWVDGGRIPTNGEPKRDPRKADGSKGGQTFHGQDYDDRQQTWEESQGRWPANLVLSHSPDCKPYPGYADPDGLETVEAWECVEDCPILLLDEQAGIRPSGARPNLQGKLYRSPRDVYGEMNGHAWNSPHNDNGSASRYFLNLEGETRFFYQPKAPSREKWFFCHECDDAYRMRDRPAHRHGHPNWKHLFTHPTQKPLGLIRYLCRLTRTPTGGTILDMFMGTGTTGEAAILEGRDFVGCELERPSYVIACRKIEAVQSEIVQASFLA